MRTWGAFPLQKVSTHKCLHLDWVRCILSRVFSPLFSVQPTEQKLCWRAHGVSPLACRNHSGLFMRSKALQDGLFIASYYSSEKATLNSTNDHSTLIKRFTFDIYSNIKFTAHVKYILIFFFLFNCNTVCLLQYYIVHCLQFNQVT